MSKTTILKGILRVSIVSLLAVSIYAIAHSTERLKSENAELTTEINDVDRRISIQTAYNEEHSESLSNQDVPKKVLTDFLMGTFKSIADKNSEIDDKLLSEVPGNAESIGAAKMSFGGQPGMKVTLDGMKMTFNQSNDGTVYGYGTVMTTADSRGLDMGHGKVTAKPRTNETLVMVKLTPNAQKDFLVTEFQSGEMMKGENTDAKIR